MRTVGSDQYAATLFDGGRHDWQPPQGADNAGGVLRQNIGRAEQFDRLACPVGLEIQAVGTHEIAVSVMAQFIQKRAEYVKRDT